MYVVSFSAVLMDYFNIITCVSNYGLMFKSDLYAHVGMSNKFDPGETPRSLALDYM